MDLLALLRFLFHWLSMSHTANDTFQNQRIRYNVWDKIPKLSRSGNLDGRKRPMYTRQKFLPRACCGFIEKETYRNLSGRGLAAIGASYMQGFAPRAHHPAQTQPLITEKLALFACSTKRWLQVGCKDTPLQIVSATLVLFSGFWP